MDLRFYRGLHKDKRGLSNLTRRALLLAIPACALADERSDLLEALAPFVAALTEGNVRGAIRRLPQDQELRDNVAALMAQATLSSSVEARRVEAGRAEVDWILNIRLRGITAASQRRQATLTVEIRQGKILSLGPASFFATVRAAQ